MRTVIPNAPDQPVKAGLVCVVQHRRDLRVAHVVPFGDAVDRDVKCGRQGGHRICGHHAILGALHGPHRDPRDLRQLFLR